MGKHTWKDLNAAWKASNLMSYLSGYKHVEISPSGHHGGSSASRPNSCVGAARSSRNGRESTECVRLLVARQQPCE